VSHSCLFIARFFIGPLKMICGQYPLQPPLKRCWSHLSGRGSWRSVQQTWRRSVRCPQAVTRWRTCKAGNSDGHGCKQPQDKRNANRFDPPLSITLSGTTVERVTTFKLLGVHVANNGCSRSTQYRRKSHRDCTSWSNSNDQTPDSDQS